MKRKELARCHLGIGTVLVVPHWHTFLHYRARTLGSSLFLSACPCPSAYVLRSHSMMFLFVYVILHYVPSILMLLLWRIKQVFQSLLVPTRLGRSQNSPSAVFIFCSLFHHAEGSRCEKSIVEVFFCA
jgi:hypothetical protein